MKKKVLIVASVISFIEWFNKENLEYLNEKYEVHLAVNCDYMEDTNVERTVNYIDRIKEEGIIVHNIPFAREPLSRDNICAYNALKSVIRSNDFALIHCHTPAASMLTRIAARRARRHGTTVMYSCHGFHFHNSSPKKNWILYYPIERFLSRFCDYIVVINHEDYMRALTFHAPNVRYIPGVGVDINRILKTTVDKQSVKESIGIPKDSIMLISIGELIERKNHEVIIRALHEINDPNIYYVICGKGQLENHLKKIAGSLEVSDNVIFLGFRQDIPELCCAADIGAFPSKIEGLGLAGIEIMAAGIPLVSSNIHGILDYVTDGKTGYAIPPTDVSGFAKAIKRLADNPELRIKMRDNCIAAVQPFEISNALRVMWDIYDEILL